MKIPFYLLLGSLVTGVQPAAHALPECGDIDSSRWSTIQTWVEQAELAGEVKPLINAIRPGMTRLAVEQLLGSQDEGPQTQTHTRYQQKPGFLILVPFDETGGMWSPENKVSGLATLTHGRWRRIKSSKL